MFDPSTLPSASPGLPRSAAATDAASSGSEVPMATMVSPITVSLMLNSRAMSIAPVTSKLPPPTSSTSPPRNASAAQWIARTASSSSSAPASSLGRGWKYRQ